MTRLMWLLAILSVAGLIYAAGGSIAVSSAQTGAQLMSNTPEGVAINYSIGSMGYLNVDTKEGNFTELNIDGYAHTNVTGMPKLPLMRKIIRVPQGAVVVPRIRQESKTTVSLAAAGIKTRILPRQESVAKCEDPTQLPFIINREFYNGAKYTTEPSVRIEEIGMMRGTRLVAVDYVPVQYNPASGQLEVITSAVVEIEFRGADWAATQQMYEKYYSSAFEPMLAQSVLNYEPSRISLDRYPLGYIIIAPSSYFATLQPFVDWKIKQGYNVNLVSTTETGTTTTAIKAYLQNIWNNATTTNPAPSYLLLVGDTPQIPAWTGSTSGGHVTDLNYVRLQGTDYVPEMYFGRFSATTVAQVQAYVDKTLQYAMYTMPDPSYLSHTVLIAGVDSYYASSHGNGQINYGKNNYFGESSAPNWVPYGPYNIRNHMYYYPASGSADAQILADMSAGAGYVNYTAHGSETTWSDPTVTIGNINAMTNTNKYFVAVGNCCLTNAFNTAECFGEAFTRAPNKGAVAYIGGTNSTYWDEDYWWAVGYKPPVVGTGSPYIPNRIGAYDALFHYNNEAFEDWGSTLGAMTFMGNMAVVASNSSRINYYWEIYSIMGDPSLIPYMGIPLPNAAQYPAVLQMGVNTMQITADPFSYVAISKDGILHGVGLANASGALNLEFSPFTSPGTAKLVMTRSLRQPLIADVQITASAGPYLLVNNMLVNDGNNSTPEAGETLYLDLVLNNVGTAVAQNVTVTLSTTSPYVNVINGTTTLASVQVNTPININNIFQIAISAGIPDQETVSFTIQMNDSSSNSWTGTRNITVNAPNLVFGNPVYFDPNNNGMFEPGEMITVTINISNTGHMAAGPGHLAIVINSNQASTPQTSFTLPGMNVGINIPLSLSIDIAPNAQTGTVVPIGLALTAGAQMVNSMISLPVGAVAEGFESGNFNTFPWVNQSTIPWTIVSGGENVQSGNYAAKSGAIGHNGLTELSITINVASAGNISFWRRVSSESGYDFLKFYIDNTEMGSWSGTQAWAQQTYTVSAGQRTFKWAYSKDYSTIGGLDSAWIDNIVFPMSGSSTLPVMYVPVTNIAFTGVQLNTPVSQNLIVRNLGTAPLSGTITVPSQVDLMFNGTAVPDTYIYTIPAGTNGIFTIGLVLTSHTTFNGNITITSNDADNPSQNVTLSFTTPNDDDYIIPAATALEGNFPNPFNPQTTIRYAVKDAGQVRIDVYNSKGQLVKTLVNDNLKAGRHSVVWNGTDDHGKPVSSGLYLYRMQAPGYSKMQKMMLMK